MARRSVARGAHPGSPHHMWRQPLLRLDRCEVLDPESIAATEVLHEPVDWLREVERVEGSTTVVVALGIDGADPVFDRAVAGYRQREEHGRAELTSIGGAEHPAHRAVLRLAPVIRGIVSPAVMFGINSYRRWPAGRCSHLVAARHSPVQAGLVGRRPLRQPPLSQHRRKVMARQWGSGWLFAHARSNRPEP